MVSKSNILILREKLISTIKNETKLLKDTNSLLDKIKSKYKDNPAIFYTHTKEEFIEQNGIKFLVRLKLNNVLDQKPIKLKKNKSKEKDEKGMVLDDVFNPETIEKDLLIDDFDKDFMLMFNKFPIIENHMLFIPKVFESQYTHITKKMFLSMTQFVNDLDCFCFFNGGVNAGASQPRKHTQIVPKSSYDPNFGLVKILNDYVYKNVETKDGFYCGFKDLNECQFKLVNEDELFFYITLNLFKRKHLFCISKFSSYETEVNFILNEAFYEAYLTSLGYLELNKENEIIHQDYTMILSREFVFVTPRFTHLVSVNESMTLNLNSLGFMMAMLCKNENELATLKSIDLIREVYEKL